MTIKEAAKVLEDKYMTMQGVYGVNIVPCKKCGGDYIEVMMDTHNRSQNKISTKTKLTTKNKEKWEH